MKISIDYLLLYILVCISFIQLTVGAEEELPNIANVAAETEKTLGNEEISGPVLKDSSSFPETEGNVTETQTSDTSVTNVQGNSTSGNAANCTTEVKANTTSIHIACNLNKTNNAHPVEILSGNRLVTLLQVEANITSRQTAASCVVVLFYAPSCPFSCMAAPHFNALPRVFPDLKMVAVDAMAQFPFNAQYGIVGVPTLMLFHNGRPAAKFNDTSEYALETFAKFVTKYTGLEPDGKLVVTSADFGGPVSSVPTKERDYCLLLSWLFIFVCSVYSFYHSAWWHWLVDATLSAWREAEAQHTHTD